MQDLFLIFLIFIYLFICLFAFSWAAPAAHGGSQARCRIGTVAAGLCHSHSNMAASATSRIKPHLQPTPQIMATLDP